MASTAPVLSLAQTQVLRGLWGGSALLSILGSSSIVVHVLAGNKFRQPLYRLILGVSVVDLVYSLNLGVMAIFYYPVLEPSKACTMDGFFSVVSTLGSYYSVALSLYYLLTIKYGVREERIRKFYEPIFHGIFVPYAITWAFVGLGLQSYNPSRYVLGCWIEPWPTNCLEDEDVDCKRGSQAGWLGLVAVVAPLLLVLVALIVNNLSLYCFVRKTHNQSLQYSARTYSSSRTSTLSSKWKWKRQSASSGQSSEMNMNASASMNMNASASQSSSVPMPMQRSSSVADSTESSTTRDMESCCSRCCGVTGETTITQRVATQSFLYVSAFFLSYIFGLVNTILSSIDPEGMDAGDYFVTMALEGFFHPAMGFYNALVFQRPKYLRWRANTDCGRWEAFRKAAFSLENPPLTRQRRRRRMATPDNYNNNNNSDSNNNNNNSNHNQPRLVLEERPGSNATVSAVTTPSIGPIPEAIPEETGSAEEG